jgi:hypothetical protein
MIFWFLISLVLIKFFSEILNWFGKFRENLIVFFGLKSILFQNFGGVSLLRGAL